MIQDNGVYAFRSNGLNEASCLPVAAVVNAPMERKDADLLPFIGTIFFARYPGDF